MGVVPGEDEGSRGKAKTRPLIHFLAHGPNDKLFLETPKQFYKVGDEMIVERTLRLLHERAWGKPVVVAPKEWDPFCRKSRLVRMGLPDPVPDLVGSLGIILGIPGDHVILLGDVVYSQDAIDRIFSGRTLEVYGKPGPNRWTRKERSESYALRVPDEARETLCRFASLPRLERLGLRFMVSELSIPVAEITDWTDDIDTREDLEKVLPRLDDFARSET